MHLVKLPPQIEPFIASTISRLTKARIFVPHTPSTIRISKIISNKVLKLVDLLQIAKSLLTGESIPLYAPRT